MIETTETTDTTKPEKPANPKHFKSGAIQTRGVLEVLQQDGGWLRSITIARRCNNGAHLLDPVRRTTREILDELNTLISTGKAKIRIHRLGGNEYSVSRGA